MRVPHWEELQTDIEVRLAGKKRRASAPREAHAHRHEQCHLLLDTVQHMIVPEAINLYHKLAVQKVHPTTEKCRLSVYRGRTSCFAKGHTPF
jgi:hypothetical protein